MTHPFPSHRVIAACAALLLSGCITVGHPTAANVLYRLETTASPASGKPLPFSLRIRTPDAAPGLDTDRIAVQAAPNRLTYYDGVAWAQPLPSMLQDFLVDDVQRAHAFRQASSGQEGIKADLELLTNIRDFEVDNRQHPPNVYLRLEVSLADARTLRTITAFSIEKHLAASENHMPAIVAAFNQAAQSAANDIVERIRKVERRNF